ncbi:BlaB/IND/MUS family subclass B1 metallo-beta-lactamase [Empedobacter stercoris]|uniref:EBR family subclass B1 metallo-beta-lactamase n=1 Tax=Empedobacter stercoris TaxID=1628248 RepID=UPI0016627391|nr:EBR family subclass B1 metallo-beta-lactamase [Empedobacter stercoris]MCA4808242.1 BlaB/IND/MUS family subclass B1 metallo-beta-lactamase [Empedobacter stercoris]QNT14384.1 BlaB/IND/MUS family subclass B1 metallo-beta-lactamase [Empedobacter stercoris]
MKKVFSLVTLIGSFAFGQIKPIQIDPINSHLYVYQTFNSFQGIDYNANGMFLITDKGIVLFDVPWQKSQYQTMNDLVLEKYHLPVIAVFVTHSHEDRAGDLSFYNDLNIPTHASSFTNSILKKEGKATSKFEIELGKTYRFGKEKFVIEYFGQGHTADNLVVWFPKYKVLNGGCLIKGADAKNLGYIGEANVTEWPKTVQKLVTKHPKINQVIPGHDNWKANGHIENTFKLLEK